MHVKDTIDYENVAAKVQVVLPGFESNDIAQAFQAWFMDSCSWDQDLVYTDEQCDEFISRLMVDFIAEQQNESRDVVKVALALQMPLSEASVSSHYPAGALL